MTLASLPILASLAVLLAFAAPAHAGPALAFDAATGRVFHAHDAFRPWHPASLTKLMSVYVTLKAVEDGRISLQSPVRISERAVAQPVNTIGLKVGAEMSLAESLRILMVKSANDVAIATAEAVSGSVEDFVAEMNATAARLGMADTNFVNPHGLHDPRHVSTARDLALLTRALIREFPQHQHVFGLAEIAVGNQVFRNPNTLLGTFPGADGMKTGYICTSGWNLAASATRDGRRLVAIVLGGLKEGQRETIAAELLEAGFRTEGAEGSTIEALPRAAGASQPVDLRPYACGGRKPPADIASFGLEGTAAAQDAPAPRPRPGKT